MFLCVHTLSILSHVLKWILYTLLLSKFHFALSQYPTYIQTYRTKYAVPSSRYTHLSISSNLLNSQIPSSILESLNTRFIRNTFTISKVHLRVHDKFSFGIPILYVSSVDNLHLLICSLAFLKFVHAARKFLPGEKMSSTRERRISFGWQNVGKVWSRYEYLECKRIRGESTESRLQRLR